MATCYLVTLLSVVAGRESSLLANRKVGEDPTMKKLQEHGFLSILMLSAEVGKKTFLKSPQIANPQIHELIPLIANPQMS
jgi:hypothetical protein